MNGVRTGWCGAVLLAVVLFGAGQLAAQEGDQKRQDTPQPDARQMDPARMAEMMKAMMPGPHHEHLKKFAGTWHLQTKMMVPGAPPTESKATSRAELILGGRYIREELSGSVMGMPFEGFGLTGYDNQKEVYQSVWVDNMSTTMMVMTGTCDESGKVFTYQTEYTDPMTGQLARMRGVLTFVNDQKYVYAMYQVGADGEDTKTMEIVYTRQPAKAVTAEEVE